MALSTRDATYDRQLRIWDQHGQARLMRTRVLCLGSGAAASEVLKNLALPDDAEVTHEDLGVNCLVNSATVGSPRAECVVRSLKELNPTIRVSTVLESPRQFLASPQLERLKCYDVVIVATLSSLKETAKLCDVCMCLNKKFIRIYSNHLYGELRVFAKEHTVVETHPMYGFPDLRIADPFPSLRDYCLSLDLNALSEAELGLVPYVVLLVQAVEQFKHRYGWSSCEAPPPPEIAATLKTLLNEKRRSAAHVNFDEALANVGAASRSHRLPENVLKILSEAEEVSVNQLGQMLINDVTYTTQQHIGAEGERLQFWLIAKTVSRFMAQAKSYPLSGQLPDMTASTERYVTLQTIYREKAHEDFKRVCTYVEELLREIVVAVPNVTRVLQCSDEIVALRSRLELSDDLIRRHIQNLADWRVLRYRSVLQELTLPPDDLLSVLQDDSSSDHSLLELPPQCPLNFYLLQRALELSEETNGSFALEQCGIADTVRLHRDYYGLATLARTPCELHTTTAVMGAVAAQEVLKLVTAQFVPLNNTFLWNGFFTEGMAISL